LALEALPEVLVRGELGRDQLQGDRALERLLDRPVDDPHAAAADLVLDPAACDDGPWSGLGHGAFIAGWRGCRRASGTGGPPHRSSRGRATPRTRPCATATRRRWSRTRRSRD